MAENDEFERAVAELKPDELSAWVREHFASEDERVRRRMLDGVLAAARRCAPGFQVRTSKDERLEDEVVAWATQDFTVVQVDSVAVEMLLDRVNRQYLRGDFGRAGHLYGRMFWGLEQWERGRPDELTGDEMLNSSLQRAGLRYLVSLYLTTRPAGRARAMLHGCDQVARMCLLVDPLRQLMEEAPLDIAESMAEFEPAWQDELESELVRAKAAGHELSPLLGWFTKSVQRSGAAHGLLRVARLSGDPVTWEEWVDELVSQQAWSDVIESVSEALSSVGGSLFGARLADVALAASFKVETCPERVRWAERSFRSEPTLRRLLILNAVDSECSASSDDRDYLSLLPPDTLRQGGRVVGAVHLVSGQWAEAARILAQADRLGWSNSHHPGHLVYPVLLWLLRQMGEPAVPSDDSMPSVGLTQTPFLDAACAVLDLAGAASLDTSLLPQRRLPASLEAVLPTLTLAQALAPVLKRAEPSSQSMETVLQCLHMAATSRVSGALDAGRRRMYGDAIRQVLALVEVLVVTGRVGEARSLFGRCSHQGRDDAAWVASCAELLTPELRTILG